MQDSKKIARSCPYLDSVQRTNLDFDFQKICSVTLSPINIYCCLTCGKFFKGRGPDTPAYTHSLEQNHYVWMNLASGIVYCLPEDYQVMDNSLDDIRFNLKPVFTTEEAQTLGTANHLIKSRDVHGNKYIAGVIGLNNLHGTDFVNAVVQALARVHRLRAFFLQRSNWENNTSRVVRAFGELMTQLWSGTRFKNAASPHEFLQAVSSASENKFKVGTRGDAGGFLAWFLTELHKSLCPANKKSSIITECFQGQVRVESTMIQLVRDFDLVPAANTTGTSNTGPSITPTPVKPVSGVGADEDALGTTTRASVKEHSTDIVNFNFLSLDLPNDNLFVDNIEGGAAIIPQTTLYALLDKYNGETTVDETLPGHIKRKKYKIVKLPECLILQLKRFNPNQFYREKNRSIVTLPTSQLDLKPFVVGEVKGEYDLVANVCHVGGTGTDKEKLKMQDPMTSGSYLANIYHPPNENWYEVQDLSVRETMPQLVAVSDTYLALYHKRE